MQQSEHRRAENVASRSVSVDLFHKFASCTEEDREAFISRWNSLAETSPIMRTLTYNAKKI